MTQRRKFDFRQSQMLIEREENIDGQVKLLIAKLNALHEDYYKKAYIILKRIFTLRTNQMKGYGYSNLAREKGINLTPHQISYIFGYRFISPKVMEKIDRGKLKTSTALYFIRQSPKFREPKYQEKAIDMYLENKITTSQVGRLSVENLMENVISDKELNKSEKCSNRILYNMKNHLRDLRIRENSFKDRNTINQIRLTSESIAKQCEQILKFGKRIDKPRLDYTRSNKRIPDSKYGFLNEPINETSVEDTSRKQTLKIK